jgi:hypothetical protein
VRVLVQLVIGVMIGGLVMGCTGHKDEPEPAVTAAPAVEAKPVLQDYKPPSPLIEGASTDGAEVVTGKALDAKGGAVVETDAGRVIYIGGLDAWPEDLFDKRVRVTGQLVRKAYLHEATVAPDGAISQGVPAGQLDWVLEDPTWELVSR